MIAILSPAKRMLVKDANGHFSIPEFNELAFSLIQKMRTIRPKSLQELMEISPKLADQNLKRYFNFSQEHTNENSLQSIFAYKGDVYVGLDPEKFDDEDLQFAQEHLRIISGLYGILKPLDLIQEYRLEMGIKIKIGRKKDLYDFWKEKVTNSLKNAIDSSGSEFLVNIASDEYFNVLDLKRIKTQIIKIHFREYKDEKLQFVSFNAKKARGSMARYIIKNRINESDSLKGFDYNGYYFDEKISKENEFWFIR
jgi:hypothetical protein